MILVHISQATEPLPPLARGEPVGTVRRHVGYESASAFAATFRQETGLTPGAYFRDPRQSANYEYDSRQG
jgi:AraC-like DNA-binding protein